MHQLAGQQHLATLIFHGHNAIINRVGTQQEDDIQQRRYAPHISERPALDASSHSVFPSFNRGEADILASPECDDIGPLVSTGDDTVLGSREFIRDSQLNAEPQPLCQVIDAD